MCVKCQLIKSLLNNMYIHLTHFCTVGFSIYAAQSLLVYRTYIIIYKNNKFNE